MLLAPDAGESAGTPPATPPAAPVLDLSAKVKLGDREMPVADIARELSEAQQLRGFRDAVTGFHRAREAGNVDELAKYSVTMLEGMGHQRAEAERLTAEFLQTSGLVEQERQEGDDAQMPAWAKSLTDKLQEMEGRLQSADRLSQEAVARQMNEHMGSSVKAALATDPEVRKMVESLTRIRGEESVPHLEKMIREQTLRNLKDRRATSGQPLQASWVSEEEIGRAHV